MLGMQARSWFYGFNAISVLCILVGTLRGTLLGTLLGTLRRTFHHVTAYVTKTILSCKNPEQEQVLANMCNTCVRPANDGGREDV